MARKDFAGKISEYLVTIGLEIHVELNTKAKMFCNCRNHPFDSQPNSHTCPICLGLPGSLPMPNQEAIKKTLLVGKALNCQIAPFSKWDRKHYFYPDLPKNFQISQYDLPLCQGGFLVLPSAKKVRLMRVHLEEDTGKLIHSFSEKTSLIDLNRAGVPLLELVTEPDMRSARQAREFCQEFQLILRSLNVSKADMEKGEMRAEVNISLAQNSKLGTKVEVKNLNSFRAVERAIDYEIKRQGEVLGWGEKIIQETRGWNDSKQKTYSQRVKETSADYRYFPEPDIPPVETARLLKTLESLAILPSQQRAKLKKWGVEDKDIQVLVRNPRMHKYFEAIAEKVSDKKILVNLIVNQAPDLKVKPDDLVKIANQLAEGRITRPISQAVISGIYQGQRLADLLAQYQKMDDASQLEQIVKQVMAKNPEVIAKIKYGKASAIAYLVGQVMKQTQGQAEPEKVNGIIKDLLKI